MDALVAALEGHKAWDAHGARKAFYGTPHQQMSDLWVRYNAASNYDEQKGLPAFNAEHTSEWYPVADDVPELKSIVHEVMEHIGGDMELGGVLITRISPGGEVAPHLDTGWHAEYYYDKYAVQLQGNNEQSFNFEGHSLSTSPGEVFWFNNQERHWVYNDSEEDRMTMIICVRPVDVK